jgi:hypothetical protein
MSERELRELYIKTLDKAHRCVWELAEIRKSAHLLHYLSQAPTKSLFKSRGAEKTLNLIFKNVACHVIIRTHAICFDGGKQERSEDLADWKELIDKSSCSFNATVCFLSHDHEEANFVKNLAIGNHVIKEFMTLRRDELVELGLRGKPLPIDINLVNERLASLRVKITDWRELASVRDSLFAHNDLMTEDWLKKNEIKTEELLLFVEKTWRAACGILSLLIYGIIEDKPVDIESDMARLLLYDTTDGSNSGITSLNE